MQRHTLLKARQQLPEWFQQHCSRVICEVISELSIYKEASRIALYRSFKGEISLDLLWENAIETNKTCYFPVVEANLSLKFIPAHLSTPFQKNRYGILEPIGTTDNSSIDIYLLPLVGFDMQGYRLGMGGGYYDRTLRDLNQPFCIGIGYAFQQIKSIQPELTDYPLNLIITEQGLVPLSPKALS